MPSTALEMLLTLKDRCCFEMRVTFKLLSPWDKNDLHIALTLRWEWPSHCSNLEMRMTFILLSPWDGRWWPQCWECHHPCPLSGASETRSSLPLSSSVWVHGYSGQTPLWCRESLSTCFARSESTSWPAWSTKTPISIHFIQNL